MYDHYATGVNDTDIKCGIEDEANANRKCKISMEVPADMKSPVLLYYELTGFYQNYRAYSVSRDELQLMGQPLSEQSDWAKLYCQPLVKLGNLTLNPCGLVANTFFNDVIKLNPASNLDSTTEEIYMREDGIAPKVDVENRYQQPQGFHYEQCLSCDDQNCTCDDSDKWSCKTPWKDENDGLCYLYHYPDDDTTQYLYETYEGIISPIEGVENEHFIVWMRTATQPDFRKLYGYIDKPISKGTVLTFDVTANFEVNSFRGSKSLVLTTSSAFGGKNVYLGPVLFLVGCLHVAAFVLFGVKQKFFPRKLADTDYLKYKSE